MIATGLLAVGFQNLAIQIPIERDRGVLKRFRGTPMPKWVYFAGKVIMVLAIGVAETALLLAVAVALLRPRPAGHRRRVAHLRLGRRARHHRLHAVRHRVLLAGPHRAAAAPAVVTPVALVLQFISGVFFVFTDLPTWMQQVAALFPLKWMCQGLRSVFLPESFGAPGAGRLLRAGPGRPGPRRSGASSAWCSASPPSAGPPSATADPRAEPRGGCPPPRRPQPQYG